MKSYRAVMLTKEGGPEVLQLVELPLREPGPGELRVRVRATGVGATDLTMLEGSYPFAPRIPFVPGYEVAGVVDAVGGGGDPQPRHCLADDPPHREGGRGSG